MYRRNNASGGGIKGLGGQGIGGLKRTLIKPKPTNTANGIGALATKKLAPTTEHQETDEKANDNMESKPCEKQESKK
jgi:hypothetical protein